MNSPKVTPMVQQYLDIKENYQDAILFYRMGDFYEMFFEDAVKAAKVLEITLTSRNKKDEDAIPMCGIPVRAVDGYIGRLIENGFKVAVCEQVEDPSKAKGIVKREVVRVVTPGMIIDNTLLDEKTNNYILAISSNHKTVGLAFLDISTGTFKLLETDTLETIIDESLRISPSEVLFPESFKENAALSKVLRTFSDKSVSYLSDKVFDPDFGRQVLIDQFNTRSLEGFGCEHAATGIGSAGALLSYVKETQKQKTEHIKRIETYAIDNFMQIDDISCRNLELTANLRTGNRKGTLLGILDRCITAMGSRLLQQWIRYPLIDTPAIEQRLTAVSEAKENTGVRKGVRDSLESVYDMERLVSKISMGRANARDLVALKYSLKALPDILSQSTTLNAGLFHLETDDADMPGHLHELGNLIDAAIREDAPPSINEGGIIKQGYNAELDELIKISRDGKGFLARLEADEKQKTGINSLKVKYNKVFGYYIEIPKTHSESVPVHYVRKQTLVNAERYITDELKTFETKVLTAQDQMADLEYRLFNDIRQEVIKNNARLMIVAGFISRLDCLFNLAEIAEKNDYTRPEMNDQGMIHIEDGRHPVVEKLITGERYIPNSVRLDNTENQILIITGPNMAGKSTILRQVALQVLMAQMGSFVPAKKAVIGMIDRIFTRVGALDNLSSGQSTFMVEMEETANIMNHAGPNSLVIMDEIGRGTSTFDGLSIAWAVAEYLHDLHGTGVKTLFATHYHELTDLSQTKNRVKNYNVAVKEWNDEIIFLRKLVEGSTNRSYGIQVARLAGIPDEIITRAKKVLSKVETSELALTGALLQDHPETADQKGQIQLSLFRSPEDIILDKLREVNISLMTPLDAINYLSELKDKADSITC